jgi:cytochrome c-type biogenesis protein CcmH/NrfG
MNFFEHQESAQKKTGFLLFLFTVAVILIVLAIYAVAVGVFAVMTAKTPTATA